jgi:putative addiction module component (TIGR02574 family)
MQTLCSNPTDKIRLLEMLLESLDKPGPKIEAAWVAESERRYVAYKRGKIQGLML